LLEGNDLFSKGEWLLINISCKSYLLIQWSTSLNKTTTKKYIYFLEKISKISKNFWANFQIFGAFQSLGPRLVAKGVQFLQKKGGKKWKMTKICPNLTESSPNLTEICPNLTEIHPSFPPFSANLVISSGIFAFNPKKIVSWKKFQRNFQIFCANFRIFGAIQPPGTHIWWQKVSNVSFKRGEKVKIDSNLPKLSEICPNLTEIHPSFPPFSANLVFSGGIFACNQKKIFFSWKKFQKNF